MRTVDVCRRRRGHQRLSQKIVHASVPKVNIDWEIGILLVRAVFYAFLRARYNRARNSKIVRQVFFLRNFPEECQRKQ